MPRSTLASHESRCSICRHPERQAIEKDYANWQSPKQMAARYKITKNSLYRHAFATNLADVRQRNVRRALEHIIEHAADIKPNGYCVVQAIAAYSRINARGEWVSRKETVNLNELFNRMSANELERYASSGELPEWFPVAVAKDSTATAESTAGAGEDPEDRDDYAYEDREDENQLVPDDK